MAATMHDEEEDQPGDGPVLMEEPGPEARTPLAAARRACPRSRGWS